VPLSAPSYSEKEIRAVAKVLRSGWWTLGPATRRLEEQFADYLEVRHAIAVSSGTAALHLTFRALGLCPGDEVLTPALTFVAASNAILHAGGSPVFVDVDSFEKPLVTASTLEKAVTAATRGLCVMHYGGHACDMDSIIRFARARGLWVVEDAAHSPGAAWKGTRCGAWGDAGCFSFFGNKNLTCAEGGLVATSRDDLAETVRALRSHGMSSLTWDRYQGHRFSYDVTAAGFNYRIDDLRSSLLQIQLGSLDRMNERRAELAALYRRILGSDPRWTIPFGQYDPGSSHHLFTVVLREDVSRQDVMTSMHARRVQTSVHYPPVHEFSFYRQLGLKHPDLRITEELGRRLVTLPLYPGMTERQVRFVCDAFVDAVAAARPDSEFAGELCHGVRC
jgi:dTDP-4-amino-4,6-dideoxygalactose transaminase